MKEIGRQVAFGSRVSDNAPLNVLFDPLVPSKGRLYALRISSPDASAGQGLSVWVNDGPGKMKGHLRCFYGGVDQGDYGLVADIGCSTPVVDSIVPGALLYSPVTQCNLNCTHCISRETRSKVSRLCPTIKEQIHAWCKAGWVKSLVSDYSGDILWADAKYGGELDFIESLGIPFKIDTNGIHLTGDVSRRLLTSRLVNLNISLDAATEETYKTIRRGAKSLKDVLDNIAEFANIRKNFAATSRFP